MRQQNEVQATFGITRRVDPAALPARFVSPDAAANDGQRNVVLDAERVVLARRLGPVAMKIELPLTSYRGVVVRIIPGLTEAEDRISVVLVHADRALDVPLFEASDDCDVIAEWRMWGSILNLPLLMEGLDGYVFAAESRLGDVVVDTPLARRRHAFLSKRRPRFASRRRMGTKPMASVYVR
ncbi:DUF6101 family protein [Terrihabitans sp. B22-R8]|uniref:DUF6101 family protein n=1 Tax=Terrihabitans sp. B22-R8 TaxID=3425128 RepID=UPI00403D0152